MTAESSPSNAGVHFPPPFIYVGGFVAGWLLERWRPLHITAGSSSTRTLGAVVLGALYLIVFVTSLIAFRRARTTLIPNRPAAKLVTDGPYRATRNPMYLSLAALYLAVTLLFNSWWPVIVLPVVILIVDRAVIAREERYLFHAFPNDYSDYCRQVRRWM